MTDKTDKAKTDKADKDSGLEDALESEAVAKDPVEQETGGIKTVDPSIQEVDSSPQNLKTPE